MILFPMIRPKFVLVVALSFCFASHQVAAQGGGASRGGAANTVEGTGRGAGGPGDGEGPGQGAGQGLGPGGRTKGSSGSSSTSQKGGGANSGGAANTVEGTGRGAGGPGDGEGPGQGAGQGLGPGGRDKDRAEKERADREKKEREDREKKERADKEREEKERRQKEKAEKDRQKQDKESAEKEQREREKKERAEKERADKEREEREKAEKEKSDKEREEKDRPLPDERKDTPREEGNDPGSDETKPPASSNEDRTPEERNQPGGEEQPGDPGKPPGRTESVDDKPDGPRGEDPRPSGGGERTADEIPSRRDTPAEKLVPEAPIRRDVVPGMDKVPGAADAERALRNITDPASARDGLFGFLFGGPRPSVPSEEAVAPSGKGVVAAERASRARRSGGAFLGMFRLEVPDLISAAKVRRIEVDPRVTSPRTLTYKSRLSRVSRWIGPLTLGLLNYVPFETMNAAVSGRMNNLMAEEKISVEETAASLFRDLLGEGKRFVIGTPPEAYAELEVTRYALDPVPTSIGRMKPTVSLTGRLYSPTGRLLWIGKGFSTIAERSIKGATVEQYEENPAVLRADFEEAVRVAARRLASQANALPRAKVTVVPQSR